jgi:sensor c-di-GMP phosphodiesterase-like protein
MRRRAVVVAAVAAGIGGACAAPWLAWHEAYRQAYETEAGLALNYARDVMYRTDETASQADNAIRRLEAGIAPPCSLQTLALMRDIDVTSSYIQAVGHVTGATMDCSSIGGPPVDLGKRSFTTSKGVTIYTGVRLTRDSTKGLLALRRGDFVALVHPDLPLDTWTAVPDVALGVLHVERGTVNMARGRIETTWLARLGGQTAATFIDDGRLVAVVRSTHYLTAAVAAIPVQYLEQRALSIAWRLVPAGLFAGLAAAAAVLLFTRQQLSIKAALRSALRRHEFFVLYQPLVDLRSGACVGAEALLRWQRPTGELVSPDLFIPVAEQSGLICRLTDRLLELVERDAGEHLANHPEFHIAINLAPADLHTHAIVARLDTLLARTGARPSNVIVEITERGFLDLDSARTVLAALRERGIEVAIDDFGTGYSSLSYLETLGLDFLKIDRTFIEAIGTGAPTSQVVGHIMAMAHTLDLKMFAEGIESEAQAAFLRSHGVHYGQGWVFGKPMPFADVIGMARRTGRAAPAQAGAD